MDRIINNRTPRTILLIHLLMIAVSAVLSFLIASALSDRILEDQIQAMLSVLGDGKFTALPDPDAVAKGEAFLKGYGISSRMDPVMMEYYHPLKMRLFWCLFLLSGGVSCISFHLSMRRFRKVYEDLDALREDCLQIAQMRQFSAGEYGEDFSCIRRVSDGVTKIAQQMHYLSVSLNRDKQFLKDFLTDFSHQMKTSLAVIRLNSDMLTDMEHLPEAQKAQLTSEIAIHLDGMETLVINALKLASLSADAIAYEKKDAPLSLTCEEAISRIQPMFREKGITLTFSPESEGIFPHDRAWMCEAVTNLLKNIADHSGADRAEMTLSVIPGAVKLCLSDNGKGIPQSEIPHLFERFGRKRNQSSMKSAGVGMAIAKQIIEAHNGEIAVYSQCGKGTKFEILFLKV